jgi:beta-galactosidase
MLVILRPGPYICGEWEAGGLPAWLLAKQGLRLRTYESQYIAAVDRWWAALLSTASKYAYVRGGPIALVQIENEYASYGDCENNADDAKYMNHLLDLATAHFGTEQLYSTIDGGEGRTPARLGKGSPWEGDRRVLATVDGGLCTTAACYAQSFANQRAFNAPHHSPKMWSELWVGWFTVWGDARAANKSSAEFHSGVAEMMSENASFSLYMAQSVGRARTRAKTCGDACRGSSQ